MYKAGNGLTGAQENVLRKMALFVRKDWIMHSGGLAHFKIECEALTEEDWDTLAFMVCDKLERLTKSSIRGAAIKKVIGVPRGGIPFAEAITREVIKRGGFTSGGITLIVDDVLTTGGSMEAARKESGEPSAYGVVVFSRLQTGCPLWIKPIFEIGWWNTEDEWIKERPVFLDR